MIGRGAARRLAQEVLRLIEGKQCGGAEREPNYDGGRDVAGQVAEPQHGIGYLPLYVANDAGFFAKRMQEQGLEPLPVRFVHVAG